MTWTLAKAKDRFSEVVRRARSEGPQTVTVRGEEPVVVVTLSEFERLKRPKKYEDLKDWVLDAPCLEDLEFERDARPYEERDLF